MADPENMSRILSPSLEAQASRRSVLIAGSTAPSIERRVNPIGAGSGGAFHVDRPNGERGVYLITNAHVVLRANNRPTGILSEGQYYSVFYDEIGRPGLARLTSVNVQQDQAILEVLDPHRDHAEVLAVLQRFSPGEAEAYRRGMEQAGPPTAAQRRRSDPPLMLSAQPESVSIEEVADVRFDIPSTFHFQVTGYPVGIPSDAERINEHRFNRFDRQQVETLAGQASIGLGFWETIDMSREHGNIAPPSEAQAEQGRQNYVSRSLAEQVHIDQEGFSGFSDISRQLAIENPEIPRHVWMETTVGGRSRVGFSGSIVYNRDTGQPVAILAQSVGAEVPVNRYRESSLSGPDVTDEDRAAIQGYRERVFGYPLAPAVDEIRRIEQARAQGHATTVRMGTVPLAEGYYSETIPLVPPTSQLRTRMVNGVNMPIGLRSEDFTSVLLGGAHDVGTISRQLVPDARTGLSGRSAIGNL